MEQTPQTAQILPQSMEFAPPQETSIWATFAFAWRRKSLIVLSVAVGLGLGYWGFVRQKPSYRSTAQVLIVEDQLQLPIDVQLSKSPAHDMHVTVLRSENVMRKAIRDGELERFKPSNLSVSGGKSGRGVIIDLGYTSPTPEECPKVLNAVMAAYVEVLGDVEQDDSKEALDLINRAKDQLGDQITKLEAEYRQLLNDSPLLVTGEIAHNIHESRLQQIEGIRSATVVENSQIQAKIDAITAALSRGGQRAALNMIVGNIEKHGVVGRPSSTTDQLFPLLLEKHRLSEKHGPDHPEMIALESRMEFIRKHLGLDQDTESTDEARKDDEKEEPQKVDYFETYLQSLAEQIKINERTFQEMTKLFEREKTEAKTTSTHQARIQTSQAEIDRKSRLYDIILSRLEEVSLAPDGNTTRIEMLHPPSRAKLIQTSLQSNLMKYGLLSVLAGFALAFLVDSADRRFRSPDEIRNELGIPVIGHIPIITPLSNRKKRALTHQNLPDEIRTVHAPLGRIAEAYRAVRTAVYFSTRGGGHQVIQVTSPTPGDGKSTLAANLAISIANSGKQVLLIDADFRRPRVHRLLGLENEVGMANVIEGSADWDDAIQTTPDVENLSILPCGVRPKDPSELLTSKRFEELLEVFREKFDLVIIDTPPVVAVTDPLNVAPRVDGVILVLRLSKNARASAKRSLEALDEIGGNLLGVVVNGVRQGQEYGTYGYNSYSSYGYGYGYGYGSGYGRYGSRYGYGYGYGDDNSYYADDKKSNKAEAALVPPKNGRA